MAPLSRESSKALEAFVGNANTGALHPLDTQRWRRFVISVVANHDEIHWATLRSILEEHGFDESGIERLTDFLEQGRQLIEMWEAGKALEARAAEADG